MKKTVNDGRPPDTVKKLFGHKAAKSRSPKKARIESPAKSRSPSKSPGKKMAGVEFPAKIRSQSKSPGKKKVRLEFQRKSPSPSKSSGKDGHSSKLMQSVEAFPLKTIDPQQRKLSHVETISYPYHRLSCWLDTTLEVL